MATAEVTETKSKRRRRGNGEGSIYQRPDGRWVASITVGYDATGKRSRRVIYGKTKKHVQDELTRLQSSKLGGTLAALNRMTVAQFLDRWLDDAARVTVRATTYYNYQAVVRKHVNPRIGGVALQKLTPAHVQGLYSTMERDGVGPSPRLLAHAVLHRALKQALKWGVVVRNVCEAVEPPRVPKADIHPLDAEQVGTLLDAAQGDRMEAIYWLAVDGGLRLGEIFGLQWSDVDFAKGTVSVQRSLTEVGGKLVLTEPKSKKSRRLIQLSQPTIDALAEHRKRMVIEGFAFAEQVFCNRKGGPMRRNHFHKLAYKPLLKRACLPSIRFHDLRHTMATLLLSAGTHPKVVQERLGHSQISMTVDTYSHVMPGMQCEAAAKMGAMLNAACAPRGNIVATLSG